MARTEVDDPVVETTGEAASREARVAERAAGIDLGDRAVLNGYGKDAQRRAADCAELALGRMRGHDAANVGPLLERIIDAVNAVAATATARGNFLTQHFISADRRRQKTATEFFANADKIDLIAIEIRRARDGLLHDVAFFDELYRETCATIEELDICIEAARRVTDAPPRIANAHDHEAEVGGRRRALTTEVEQAAAVDRLQRRVLQLDQVRHVLLQHLPQIRLVQHGDETLLDNLEAALTLTIPLWKQRVAILLGLTRQKDALAMQRGVAEATNRLMTETGELLHSQVLEIQQLSQKGLIDVSVLEGTNRKLIDTIEALLASQRDSAQMREECHAKMAAVSAEMRETIAQLVQVAPLATDRPQTPPERT